MHDGFVCIAGGAYEPSYCEDLLMKFEDDDRDPRREATCAANRPMKFKNLEARGHSVVVIVIELEQDSRPRTAAATSTAQKTKRPKPQPIQSHSHRRNTTTTTCITTATTATTTTAAASTATATTSTSTATAATPCVFLAKKPDLRALGWLLCVRADFCFACAAPQMTNTCGRCCSSLRYLRSSAQPARARSP